MTGSPTNPWTGGGAADDDGSDAPADDRPRAPQQPVAAEADQPQPYLPDEFDPGELYDQGQFEDGQFEEGQFGGAEFGEQQEEEEPVELVFRSVDDFVTEYLSQVVRRRVNRATAMWCPEWWQHPEAIARITALWRAFEYLRLDAALGMSTWWLHHADPHLRALMDPDYGPFALCDIRDGHSPSPPEPLPITPSPPELWDHPAFSLDAAEREEAEARAAAEAAAAENGKPKEKGLGSDFGM